MRIATVAAISLALAVTATHGFAAQKPAAKAAAAKPAPACAALVFRPLPAGAADGEQTAGMYRSRLARLELHGTVQGGVPTTYYLVANGAKMGAAAPALPPAASDCAVAKKMPRPGAAAASCTGERFTVVTAHSGNTRVALLYALSGATWSFCNAGSF